MVLYLYRKKPVRIKKKSVLLPSLFLTGGVLLLFMVVWPILTFEFFLTPKLKTEIISPLPFQTQVLGARTDLNLATNWFPSVLPKIIASKITSYTLSIPKLGIKDAIVVNNDEDLSKHLVQWGGTGNPGSAGSTVIFGHSVLPVFFDPKNYWTIFSTLPTIKEGDDIYTYYDGITYHYQVIEMQVIDPKDISVLEQSFDNSYLSLVTCVPPGTYWKRLVVRAKLVKLN